MTTFMIEHKIDVVVRYQSQLESVREIARSIGANPGVVHMWIKQFEHHGLDAFVKFYTTHTMRFKMDVLTSMSENGGNS